MELSETELCKLAYKYGTDKCPRIKHSYTPFYFEIFKDRRESVKKVLELGIGLYRGWHKLKRLPASEFKQYNKSGASLYMWRDFFPSAKIYGADNRTDTLFEDERIKTYLCDERIKEDLIKLVKKTGSDIDIVVDDASHQLIDQIRTCRILMPMLNKGVTYIIEDVAWTRKVVPALKGYDCQVPAISRLGANDQIVVVKHK